MLSALEKIQFFNKVSDKTPKCHTVLYLNTSTEENKDFIYNSGKKNLALLSKVNFLTIQSGNSFKFLFRKSAKYCQKELVLPAIKPCFKISGLFQFSYLTYLMTTLTLRMIVESTLKFSFLCFEEVKWRLCSPCFFKELKQSLTSMSWNPCVFIPLSRIHLHNNSG